MGIPMSNSQASCILMLRASVVLTVPGCGAVEPTDGEAEIGILCGFVNELLSGCSLLMFSGAVASGVNLILWVMGADQNADPLNNIFDQSQNM